MNNNFSKKADRLCRPNYNNSYLTRKYYRKMGYTPKPQGGNAVMVCLGVFALFMLLMVASCFTK